MNDIEFKKRYNEIVEWCVRETEKITKKLKRENKIHGLDTNKEEYELIHQQYKKKIKKLKEEYSK